MVRGICKMKTGLIDVQVFACPLHFAQIYQNHDADGINGGEIED